MLGKVIWLSGFWGKQSRFNYFKSVYDLIMNYFKSVEV